MRIGRVSRRGWSGSLVLALLFTLFASAAYACPLRRDTAATQAVTPCTEMVSVGMALAADQPGLCMQHCQFGNTQQPPDASLGLQAPPMALTRLFVVAPMATTDVRGPPRLQRERVRERAPRLALSIAHCCLRT